MNHHDKVPASTLAAFRRDAEKHNNVEAWESIVGPENAKRAKEYNDRMDAKLTAEITWLFGKHVNELNSFTVTREELRQFMIDIIEKEHEKD